MVPRIPELRLSVTGEAIESDTSKPITTGPGNNDRLPQAIAIPARVIGPDIHAAALVVQAVRRTLEGVHLLRTPRRGSRPAAFDQCGDVGMEGNSRFLVAGTRLDVD